MSHVDHIRSYYESLNSGDADAVAAHFTEDAVHYYTRLGPHEGAETIGGYAAFAVENIEGRWHLENAIEQGDQVAIEWTTGEARLDRGAEWFLMRDGRIAEVRAYHHGGRKNPQGDLLGFDHEGRGYTMLESKRRRSRPRCRFCPDVHSVIWWFVMRDGRFRRRSAPTTTAAGRSPARTGGDRGDLLG